MKKGNVFFIIMLLSCNYVEDKTKLSKQYLEENEQKASVNGDAALAVYDENFTKNFQVIRDKDFLHDYKKIIYVEGNHYYIGYRNTMDKRGDEIAALHFLAKINTTTGEISVVK